MTVSIAKSAQVVLQLVLNMVWATLIDDILQWITSSGSILHHPAKPVTQK
jgi:hypothetical protein